MSDAVTVLVGTTKGAFILDSDAARADWTLRGPFCELWPINHVIGDGTGNLWAAGGSKWDGAGIWRSADGGDSWTLAKLADGEADQWRRNNPEIAETLGLPETDPGPFTGEIDSVWSLCAAHGRVLAGCRPAMLYASHDGGATWENMRALSEHPSRDSWMPGGAGLTLHTIVAHPQDPQKIWVGISTAGVFATEDSGTTWDRRNRRDNACARAHSDHPAAGTDTEIGMCVHNMVRADTAEGDLLYQQNHHGVLRSPDGGRSWLDVTQGLPSTFGFPVAVHPQDPQTIWVIPMNGDSIGRYPPEARAVVWRSRNGGDDWEATRDGLPGQNCFFTVLRQAMATDHCAQAGVYFGTNSGSVFATRDEGDSWQEIARHLPTVLSVETLPRA